MGITLTNNAHTTLSANISSTDTTIYVDDVDSFPALDVGDYFYCTLESTTGTYEIVKVTQVNATNFIVERAQENTIAVPFNIGARVELRVTVQALQDLLESNVSDEAYGSSWNADTATAPSRNAVYDKFVSVDASIVAAVSDATYDETTWNSVTTIAPSKNAVRDKFSTIDDLLYGVTREATVPTQTYGYFSNRATNGDFANPIRTWDRVFLGFGAAEDGTTVPAATWLSSDIEPYFARSAQLLSISAAGGAGGVFATRVSDIYDGEAVWTTGEAVVIGDKRGYRNSAGARSIYTATTNGTTGATPPTHTTGTASDGTVTWQFTQSQFRTPMAVAALAYNDAAEGGAAWAGYFEGIKGPSAGDTTVVEIDVQNAGANVNIHPYSMFTSGLTAALWMGCQQNVYGPAATAPSSAAVGIVGNAAGGANYKFNKGIVFHSASLTDEGGGSYVPMALFEGCRIRQYVADGTNGAALIFNVTANNERTAVSMQNRAVYLQSQGAIMGGVLSDAAAGVAPDEYLALHAQAASTGYATLQSHGTASNINIRLLPKGSGVVTSSANFTPTANDGASLGISGAAWADLFIASGGVINFNAGDVVITHSANTLAFSGASSGYTFDAAPLPSANDGAALGASGTAWADVFLASGAVVNFNAGNYTLTHSAGNLVAAGGPFTAPAFIPSGSTVPSNGTYLPAANTLGWAINSAAAAQMTATVFSPAASDGMALGSTSLMWSDLFLADGSVVNWGNGDVTLTYSSASSGGLTFAGASNGYAFNGGSVTTTGNVRAANSTAITSGGSTTGFLISSTSSFGVFCGSGAPTISAAKGSLYLRSDGSGTNDRMYVNTNGSTTWTAVVTVA